MNIGIIGCGSIAKKLVEFQLEDKLEVNIAYFYDIDHESAVSLAKKADAIATEDINDLIENCDLIMEAASQGAVRALMPNIIDHGCDVIIMSVGALMDEDVRSQLEQKAENSGSKIHLPTGAITGIDTVKAATLGEITSISLTTRKPPKSLSVEVEGMDEVVLFDGKASDAVNEFPKNINVSSTFASNTWLMISPLVVFIGSISTSSFLAASIASASFSIVVKSIPVTSFIASIIVILFQFGVKSISWPW